jgi:quinoprotein glucose dehydrogenase
MAEVKKEQPQPGRPTAGRVTIYKTYCMSCHGEDRKGSGDFPALLNLDPKYNEEQFKNLLTTAAEECPLSIS